MEPSSYFDMYLHLSVSSNFHLQLHCAIRNNPVGIKSRAEELNVCCPPPHLPKAPPSSTSAGQCISYPETLAMTLLYWRTISPCEGYWENGMQ